MDEEDQEDRIIRERKFKIGFNIDIDELKDRKPRVKKISKGRKKDGDPALGSFFDPFEYTDENSPGIMHQDGSISSPPERDVITEISIEGERKINWIIMVSMIVIYSIISILVGLTFDTNIAIIILLLLAGFGFTLGEIWIPDEKMNLLGVTWVIISMKVLYGLSIELRNWDVIGVETLVLILISLVSVNIYVAYRHNHDAIAAQSTLVLLAIGSSTGSILGEEGVAGMILISTVLLHGLAIHRKSGNLAALGIASSNLWIGMHAITDGFVIGELVIIKLDSSLLLFLLLMVITGLNAAMAAKFSKEPNWFSSAFKVSGLGEPGLWGVSVSLGMVGALLSVAANREDLGYALGMVTFLSTAFGGSYLSVRGVQNIRIIKPIIFSLPFLVIILLFSNQIGDNFRIDGYDLFTILGTILTGYIILKDQNNVSDRVLWLGSVVLLILLVLLVPSSDTYSEEEKGLFLLGSLSILHISTAILSIKRDSPSLGGVTVILPWAWILVHEITRESISTFMIVNDKSEIGSAIQLGILPLVSYLTLCLLLMVIVNLKLGATNINLASKFLGITEISALIKNSEILQLWNIGIWLPLISIITLAQLGGFNAITLLFILTLLIMIHTITQRLEKRVGSDSNLLLVIITSIIIIQWLHGLNSFIVILSCLSIVIIISKNDIGDKIGTGMILVSMPILISISRRGGHTALKEADKLPNLEIEWVALICTTIIIIIYLCKADKLERILKPTLASLFLIITTISLSWQSDIIITKYMSLGLFVFTSIWLVSRGELRSELKTMALKDSRIEIAKKRKDYSEYLPNLVSNNGIGNYDPLVAFLNERQNKSREQKKADNLEDFYVSDLSHRPIILLAMLSIIFIASIGRGLISGPEPIVLLCVGLFATLLVGIARYRTKSLDLSLPHILGIEIPIAMAITGLVIIHNISHIAPFSSNIDLLDLAILSIFIMGLTIISILNQNNLIDRIPVAIDWFIIPLFISRIVGALMNESLPFPLTVDPFLDTNSLEEFLEWNLPWLLLEFLLILTLICDFWIVNKREKISSSNNKPNRGIRNLAIVMISFGPAGTLAVISTIRQGYRTNQPNTVGMGIFSIGLVMFSFGSWVSELMDLVPMLVLFLGILMLLLCATTIKSGREKWTIMATINSHLLIITGLLWTGYFDELYFSMLMILMSSIIWIVGILQLRRILRILGLLDLIMAILLSLIFVPEILDTVNLLICLTMIAIELGIIGWLGIYNEKELIKD